MSDNRTQLTRVTGTGALAPFARAGSGSGFAFPFAIEARNWSERRQFQSYVKVYRARCDLLALLVREQQLANELHASREQALVQLENIESVREIEGLKIRTELNRLRIKAEMQQVRYGYEKDKLEAERRELRLRAEAGLPELRVAVEKKALELRLADLAREEEARVHPPEAPQPRTPAEQIRGALGKIRDIGDAIHAERAALVEAAGGEEHLSDEMHDQLAQVDMLGRVLVEQLYEDLAAEMS